ncbi:MAG: hypothetical protein WKG32_08165 [Gemmatimonadaceae bacterium]
MTTRVTPYEVILEPLEAALFPMIREEAEARGTDTRRRDQFVLLGHAGIALKEMMADDAPADSFEEYAELLYHGYQFWAFGRRTYVFDPAIFDRLTAPAADLRGWILAGPPACYFQFPYLRLWSRVSPDAPFEPVDGCFVVVDDTEPAPDAGAHLRALLVLGLRPDRPGISLVSYRTDLDPTRAAALGERPRREGAEPFANAIPGGERQGYRTLATTSELEALLIRAMAHLDRSPRALEAQPTSNEEGWSRLPYVLVREG